ncbi:hypothetical protein J2Y67_005625 [Neobacillus niacini]|nr:hypothetical protein [Neobacillus niacini]
MEKQYCSICGNDSKENVKDLNSSVFVICENCLREEQLNPMLDQIFLN